MENEFSAIILASGFSERMGKPKAMLHWDNTTTFLEKIAQEFTKAACSNIICVVNEKIEPLCRALKNKLNVTFITNKHPEWGRTYSISLASKKVKDCSFSFIHNVDNPFVDADIINKIFKARSKEAWCSPVYQGKGGHPILLPPVIINKISQINEYNNTLLYILKPYQRINVEIESDIILRNINTKADYSAYF